MRTARRFACVALAGLVGLGGLALPAAAAEHEVEIRDNRFVPDAISVRVGDTVRWVNRERRTSHSVLFKSPVSFESPRFFPDESWSYRVESSGEYRYSCGPHPEMAGTIKAGE